MTKNAYCSCCAACKASSLPYTTSRTTFASYPWLGLAASPILPQIIYFQCTSVSYPRRCAAEADHAPSGATRPRSVFSSRSRTYAGNWYEQSPHICAGLKKAGRLRGVYCNGCMNLTGGTKRVANSWDKICGGMHRIRSWELWIQSQPVDDLNQQWSTVIGCRINQYKISQYRPKPVTYALIQSVLSLRNKIKVPGQTSRFHKRISSNLALPSLLPEQICNLSISAC